MESYFGNFILYFTARILQFQMNFRIYATIEVTVQSAYFFLNIRYEFLIGMKMHRLDINVHHTHT